MSNLLMQSKRESLERFLREQTLGTGVCGYRFLNIYDEHLSKDLLKEPALNYVNELINILPAGVYSTGILFPVDKSNSNETGNIDGGENETIENEDLGVETGNIDDVVPIDQMYPHSMGLTCFLDSQMLSNFDLIINVKARHYDRLDHKHPEFRTSYGVLCESEPSLVSKFITDHELDSVFECRLIKKNFVLLLKPQTDISSLKKSLWKISEEHASKYGSELIEYNLRSNFKSLSSIKQSIYYELKRTNLSQSKRDHLYNVSQKIEFVESVIEHLSNLVEISDSRGYGLWRSEIIDLAIPFPEKIIQDSNFKQIFSYKDSRYPSLLNIFRKDYPDNTHASLSLNVQISKSLRREKNRILFKVQVINTSTEFTKESDDPRYYSTFNEKVNQRCFFGLKVRIKHKMLRAFNSQLNVDPTKEEDVIQFKYRQYQDYGNGHGCSVKWSKEDGIMCIESEYIPTCDTPEIDTVPRDKSNRVLDQDNRYICKSIIKNPESLSFKFLSVLSNETDRTILEELKKFIEYYKHWIDEKREEYKSDSMNVLVNNELDACEKDFVLAPNSLHKIVFEVV